MQQTKGELFNVTVKTDNRDIQVYKIKNTETYNIYLGDKISMRAIAEGKHTETFTKDQLIFK